MNLPASKRPTLTAEQKRAVLEQVRELTNHGRHYAATLLYNSIFPA